MGTLLLSGAVYSVWRIKETNKRIGHSISPTKLHHLLFWPKMWVVL